MQFLANWSEGIFVFKDKAECAFLDESCTVKKAVGSLLMEAALAEDQNVQILSLLKAGQNSILEKVWDFEQKWELFKIKEVQFIDETVLEKQHKDECLTISRAIDGFAAVTDIIELNDQWPANKVLKYLHVLLTQELVTQQTSSIMALISRLQSIACGAAAKIGFNENLEMLRSSVEDSGPENPSIFLVDEAGNLCVNFHFIKERGLPISVVCQRIEQLSETYLSYCAAELEPEEVQSLVATTQSRNSDHLSEAL